MIEIAQFKFNEFNSNPLPLSQPKQVVQAKWHPHEFNFLSSSADKTSVLWSLPSH